MSEPRAITRPASAECAEHWARIRASLPPLGNGFTEASVTRPDFRPPLTLKQQAAKQIAILERDLAEWREIEARTP